MGYRQFSTVRDEDDVDEEIVAPPAAKLAEVERRFERRGEHGSLSVADFEEGERTTTVQVEQLSGRVLALTLTYDPNLLTEATTQDIQTMNEDGDPLSMAELFCDVVTSWKFYGPLTARRIAFDEHDRPKRDDAGRIVRERVEIVPDGQLVPLDPAVVQYLPTGIVLGIWREIGKEIGGDPKENRHSRRRSRRR